MDIQVAESGPCRKTITIRIPPEKVRQHIEGMYRSASQQVQMKGFRPGKVPRKVLEQRYGEAIAAEAKETLVNQSFREAMQGQGFQPIGAPKVEGLDASPLDPAAALEFQVHVDVRPEFKLGKVKGLSVKRGDPSVTDEDMESGLNQLAGQKRKLGPVAEPAADGDFLQADVTYRCDGAVVHEQKGLRLNTGIPLAGSDPTVFADKLRGASKGDSRTIALTFPPNFEVEAVRGKPGEADLAIQDVLRVQSPPLDDEFAKGFDFDSIDALKEELRKRIGAEKERQDKLRQEDECIEALLGAHDFPLPPGLVDDETEAQLKGFEHRLKQAETPEDQIPAKVEEARGEARQEAEKRVRVFFILDAVARDQKIFVTEGDMEEALRSLAAQNQTTVDVVRKHYEERNMMADLRLGILERKVRDLLRANATIADS